MLSSTRTSAATHSTAVSTFSSSAGSILIRQRIITLKIIKKCRIQIAIFVIIAVAAILRLYLYGDPRLSIGMNDTQTYIQSSRTPIFSWESLAGQRPFTMNLVYHTFVENTNNCHLSVIVNPSVQNSANRKIQACFDQISLLQNLLSILGWSLLAWEMSSRVKTSFYKILITIIILSFAFSPQIAEWDSVLGSESLTLSLFPICLAFLIEVAFQLFENQTRNNLKIYVLLVGCMIVFSLWAFVQDANLYFLPMTVILLIPLIIKDRIKNKALMITSFFLIGLLALGLTSSANSIRWQPTIRHSYEKFIFPYSSRVNDIKGLGAPDPNSPEFMQWFNKKAPSVYLLFLASHPGFIISQVFDSIYMFSTNSIQPYFRGGDVKFISTLTTLGQFFHPESSAVYLIDILLLIFLCHMAITQKSKTTRIWAWIGTWVYVSSAAMLFVRYFGDAQSVLRHILVGVEFYRLLLWILLIIQADLLTTKENELGLKQPI